MTHIKKSNRDKYFTEDTKVPPKEWLKALQNESVDVVFSVNKNIFILANKGNLSTIKISLQLLHRQYCFSLTNSILRAVIKWKLEWVNRVYQCSFCIC